jgi:ABC-2 type transport system permease protein
MKLSLGLSIAKISWSNSFIYRLNFIMWRVRSILQLLMLYFLWHAITKNQASLFGYSQAEMLTYIILGTSVLRTLVFGSRSLDIQSEISTGDLSNYLIKPLNYFSYWLFRDLADKLLNFIFVIAELGLFILIFRPPLFIQTQPFYLTAFFIALILAILMYFFFSLIISLTTFWYPEQNGWPQRFMLNVLIQFISGRIFPLNILPPAVFRTLQFLPTSFFIFTPLQIYLAKLSPLSTLATLGLMLLWILLLRLAAQSIWSQGLKKYAAYGR